MNGGLHRFLPDGRLEITSVLKDSTATFKLANGPGLNLQRVEIRDRNGRVTRTVARKDIAGLRQDFITRVTTQTRKLLQHQTCRLLADRNIESEDFPAEGTKDSFLPNGDGYTSLMCANRFVMSRKRKVLITETLLAALNRISEPDYSFTEIDCQKIGDSKWEITLSEHSKPDILLSDSGSGLKTILLVLGWTILEPFKSSQDATDLNGLAHPNLDGRAFLFEELENNLHPSILRRLLQYLVDLSRAFDCRFFYTTHSNIMVDVFSGREDSQIAHIRNSDNSTTIDTIESFSEQRGVLEDLDFRASDLLQANVVIWVEGPSDRYYLNRWIELWSEGRLSQGLHYQVLSYGGALIHYLSGAAPSEEHSPDDYTEIFRVCNRAVVLVDSDKTKQDAKLKPAVERMQCEMRGDDMFWVTAGKEVENYLPEEAITAAFPSAKLNRPKLSTRASIYRQYRNIMSYEGQKPEFARRMCPHLTLDTCLPVLDLGDKMSELIAKLYTWNNLQGLELLKASEQK
ncbi:MAG: hypothetical protein Aurels2KO_55960 [Aureliella sp.]